jgi:DNA-binding NarL/FixJ family response regulator
MITVLLADNECLIRSGVVNLLAKEPDIKAVAEAVDGREAVDLTRRHRPDVVLMDLEMPVMDGVTATRTLTGTELTPGDPYRPRVLVLSTYHEDARVAEALRAGACGFLVKHVVSQGTGGDLAAGIREVAAGGHYLHPKVTGGVIAAAAAAPAGPPGPLPGVLDELSTREREVLRNVALGYENGEIAARLYVSEATVRTHMGHIFSKLRVRSRAQAIVVAYQNRLLPPGPPPAA